jgi:hypothetical protein
MICDHNLEGVEFVRYKHTIVINNARWYKEQCQTQLAKRKLGEFVMPPSPGFGSPSFRTFESDIAEPTIEEIRAVCGGLDQWRDDEIGPFMRIANMEVGHGRPEEDGAEERTQATDGGTD